MPAPHPWWGRAASEERARRLHRMRRSCNATTERQSDRRRRRGVEAEVPRWRIHREITLAWDEHREPRGRREIAAPARDCGSPTRCRRHSCCGVPPATPTPPRRCSTPKAPTRRRPPSTVSHELLNSKHKSSSLTGIAGTAALGVKRQRARRSRSSLCCPGVPRPVMTRLPMQTASLHPVPPALQSARTETPRPHVPLSLTWASAPLRRERFLRAGPRAPAGSAVAFKPRAEVRRGWRRMSTLVCAEAS